MASGDTRADADPTRALVLKLIGTLLRELGDPKRAALIRRIAAGGVDPAALERLAPLADPEAGDSARLRALRPRIADAETRAILEIAAADQAERPGKLLNFVLRKLGDPKRAALIRRIAAGGVDPAALERLAPLADPEAGDSARVAGVRSLVADRTVRAILTAAIAEDRGARLLDLAARAARDPVLGRLLRRLAAGTDAGALDRLSRIVGEGVDDATKAAVLRAVFKSPQARAALDSIRRAAAPGADGAAAPAPRGIGDDRRLEALMRRLAESPPLQRFVEQAARASDAPWREKARIAGAWIDDPAAQAMLGAVAAPETTDDQIRFFAGMVRHASYAEDLFATRADAEWLNDPAFEAAYRAGASISTWGLDIRWRVHTLLRCAARAARIPGDFVECGVDRGGTAMCVIAHLSPAAFAGRRFYMFDTFEGLERAQMTEAERGLSRLPQDRYPPTLEFVRKTFAAHPFVRIVPGAVPETLSAFDGDRVAYLHIDMNVAYPERAAFEFFWPRLSAGAPVVFDDYGFPFHREQRKELDAAAAALGVEIMMLPTGQGLVWR